VLKRTASDELFCAIRAVASGGTHFDSTLVTSAFLDKLRNLADQGKKQVGRLTEREETVLRMTAWGYTNQETAARLSLSVKTIEAYKFRLGKKLGLHGRSEVVRYALRRGWLNLEDGDPCFEEKR
jgi:DNA-binding NarL/FixJ family response regulator